MPRIERGSATSAPAPEADILLRHNICRAGPISASRTAAGSYNIERELPVGCAEIPINTTGNQGALFPLPVVIDDRDSPVGEQKERWKY